MADIELQEVWIDVPVADPEPSGHTPVKFGRSGGGGGGGGGGGYYPMCGCAAGVE